MLKNRKTGKTIPNCFLNVVYFYSTRAEIMDIIRSLIVAALAFIIYQLNRIELKPMLINNYYFLLDMFFLELFSLGSFLFGYCPSYIYYRLIEESCSLLNQNFESKGIFNILSQIRMRQPLSETKLRVNVNRQGKLCNVVEP